MKHSVAPSVDVDRAHIGSACARLSRPILLAAAVGALVWPTLHATQAAPKRKYAKSASASKSRRAKATRVESTRLAAAPRRTVGKLKPLPRYLPLNQLKLLQAARANIDWTGLTPTLDGRFLPKSMMNQSLPLANGIGALPPQVSVPALPKLKSKKAQVKGNAQRFPRTIPPARVGPARPRTAPVPRWVRYPLEFQLCGIGLGTRAVDKDRLNRIDRYGLFALHGNPTSVVVPGLLSTPGTGGPGDVAVGGAGGGGATTSGAATTAPQIENISINQRPPEVSALFPDSQSGDIPDWASAITVQLDNNHVQWLYNRDTYSMGFVVDRLGFCDAIVVAGTASPIARTQLEDPVHTIRLGDDLRKVLFRYGYPDTIESYTTVLVGTGTPAPAAGGAGATGGAGGAPATPPAGGATGGAGGAATVEVGNEAFRTFELRYEQSYNVVFTIRNNRVVRIYIFGDPDFFNERRRRQFRTAY